MKRRAFLQLLAAAPVAAAGYQLIPPAVLGVDDASVRLVSVDLALKGCDDASVWLVMWGEHVVEAIVPARPGGSMWPLR